jgi:hypothetical protein
MLRGGKAFGMLFKSLDAKKLGPDRRFPVLLLRTPPHEQGQERRGQPSPDCRRQPRRGWGIGNARGSRLQFGSNPSGGATCIDGLSLAGEDRKLPSAPAGRHTKTKT